MKNKWIVKFVFFAMLKKVLTSLTTNIEDVNSVVLKETSNATMKVEIKY